MRIRRLGARRRDAPRRSGRVLRRARGGEVQRVSPREGLPQCESLARLRQCRPRRRRDGVGLVPEERTQGGGGRKPGFRDAVHDDPRHRVHGAGGRHALVPALELSQAALALHRTRPLQRHVRARAHAPGRPAPPRDRRSAPRLQGVHGGPHRQGVQPGRGARSGGPGLYGPRHAMRRPDGPPLRLARGDRTLGGHHGRADLRPWRLPRRPLDGGEGPLPRAVGEDSPHHPRSGTGGRCNTRHDLRRAGRGHRPRAHVPGGRRRGAAAPYPRRPITDAVGAGRISGMAGVRRERVRLLDQPCRVEARREPFHRAALHDRRQTLEAHACRGHAATALRSGDGPAGVRRSLGRSRSPGRHRDHV